MNRNYYVVSLSGGKDSTAMLLRLLELQEQIDEVVFCDTYKEFPAMYKHIEKLKKVVEDAGIKFTELRSNKSYDYYMFEHCPQRKKESLRGKTGYSWAGSKSRWCTSKLKTDVIKRYSRELSKTYNVIQMIGIASDEKYRLERANNKNTNFRYPLVEWDWTEKDCLEYCYSKGYDWDGLYKIFDHVSCWCCPLQSLKELRNLRKHYPDLWNELKNMDNRTWRTFKDKWTVEQLEIRFEYEEECIVKGKSITNREFFLKLKVLLSNKQE